MTGMKFHFLKCQVLNTPKFPSLCPCWKTSFPFPPAADHLELFQLSNRTGAYRGTRYESMGMEEEPKGRRVETRGQMEFQQKNHSR